MPKKLLTHLSRYVCSGISILSKGEEHGQLCPIVLGPWSLKRRQMRELPAQGFYCGFSAICGGWYSATSAPPWCSETIFILLPSIVSPKARVPWTPLFFTLSLYGTYHTNQHVSQFFASVTRPAAPTRTVCPAFLYVVRDNKGFQ